MGKIHKNIVAQYRFENILDLGVDSSGNEYNANNYGASLADGVFGRGGKFDGSNDNMKLFLSSPSLQNSCTILLWVRPENTSKNRVFIANQGSELGLVIRQSFLTESKFQVGYGNTVGGAAFNFQSNLTYSINTWYHLALVVDNSVGINTAKLYINGDLDNQSAIIGTVNAPTYPFYVASYNTGVSFFNGIMDDIRIYDTPLPSTDIKRVMHGLQPISI